DRTRYLILRIGIAAHDQQNGKPRLQGIGGRAGHSHRLFVQSRRHLHLSDHGGHLPRAGDEYGADAVAAARYHRGAAADLERGCRRDRQRLHRACSNARFGRPYPGREHRAYSGRRPLHVGSARSHQSRRQWRGDRRGVEVGRCPRRESASRAPRTRDGIGGRCAGKSHAGVSMEVVMRARMLRLVVCAAALLLWNAPSLADEPSWPDHLYIGTASPGGTYYVYGEGLARILTRVLELPVVRLATEGPGQNIELLEKGEARLGFVTTGIALQAWNATGIWAGKPPARAMR